jgi:uncharacterized protein (TIGR02145 family)
MYTVDNLKSSAYWLQPNTNTNETTFDARGAGYFNSTTQRFEDMLGYTAFWSSDAASTTTSTCLCARMRYNCPVLEFVDIKLTNAISIRCILD